MRIVSLLPSATEMICGLGLRDQLVGVSHECDFPASVAALPKVTRSFFPADATSAEIDQIVRQKVDSSAALYSLDTQALLDLRPDVIVTQSLCDVCAVSMDQVQAVADALPCPPTIVPLEPTSIDDVMDAVRQISAVVGCEDRAGQYVESLRNRMTAVIQRSGGTTNVPRVMLLEWIDPPFSAGHWNPELVSMAGGREMIGRSGHRSTAVPWDSVIQADPEVMVIACCGFTVKRAMQDMPILCSQPDWGSLACVRTRRVHVVDGSAYFNRPGPRLVDSLEILAHTIHPDVHPLPPGLKPAVATER
ncbi:corrinoid ABC transporter substrate-binding protein [Rubripirellula lacrimiformis]|uniref:Corrinoid ABC transporter substrate-binding protein n=1 Tax=Rubripirellula lacrimiformis TaxID=1930273 RepID=A0A517NCR5_9BACT|nr:cobalamin-binding protein [Rubripirellula lacrimiformis]QDT04935.1 corrinoid ABC transporter substrate-binding protein [Rubripirellula lacrimiformis]